jgi:hypothetical protein
LKRRRQKTWVPFDQQVGNPKWMCDLETIGLPNARLTSSWAWAFLRVAASYGDEINADDMVSVLTSHSLIVTIPFGLGSSAVVLTIRTK